VDRSLTQLRNDASVMNYSVAKALAILEYLADAEASRDLGVISHALGIHKSTVYRFLTTLESFGYINQDEETGRYALGSRVVWLASKFLDNLDIRTLARPYLEELVEISRETVHLAILDNFEVVYIDKVDGHQPVKMASRVGNRMPAHSTGLGKALLAFIDESQWPVFVHRKGLPSFTPNTINEPEKLYRHLSAIKERGFAIDDCENEDGIRCIAVPVRDHTGKVVAAISISGWSLTMTPDRDEELATLAGNTAQTISERLGSIRIPRENNT
jgi:IclR family acetate operon transcriptional repressor